MLWLMITSVIRIISKIIALLLFFLEISEFGWTWLPIEYLF